MAAKTTIDFKTKALIALIALSIGLAFSLSPWARGLDEFVYDTLFAVRGRQPAPQEVVVVAIDEPSFSALGLQWPWPRSVHAEVIDRIFADGAAAVGVDIVFAEPSEIQEDAALTAVLEAWPDTVLAVDINVIEDDKFTQQTIVGPWPELLGPKTALGYVNLPVDSDGFVRSADYSLEGLAALSFETARRGAAKLGRNDPAKLARALARGGSSARMGINFFGPARSIKTVSYYQALIPDHLPEGFFKDKIVFIGLATASDPHGNARPADHFPTPFMRWQGGYMAGVEIHAQAAATLLSGRAIKLIPWRILFYLGLGLGVVAALVFFQLRPLSGVLILAGLTALMAGTAWLMFSRAQTYLPVIFLSIPITAAYIGSPFAHYWQIWKEKTFIRKAFSSYLAPSVVAQLIDQPELLSLGGKKEELTVLFSDIRSFTTISEGLTPEVLSQTLNAYLDKLTAVTFKHEGVVDKFIGDAVMVIFGAPVPQADHASRACATALDMIEELARLNPRLEEMGGQPFKIGIGLNTGPMVVGNLGSSQRFDYTVIGDNVNLGSRLEGQTKEYGVDIIVSRATRRAAGNDYHFRILDLITVKGKSEPVAIYELLGAKSKLGQEPPPLSTLAAKAFELYSARQFEEALAVYNQLLALAPDDTTGLMLKKRCQTLMNTPPPEDWQGVEIKKTK